MGFNVKLLLIGDGSLMPWIRNFININKLNDRVIVTGFIEQKKVYEFLKQGGIFVLPSFTEGMSNSLLQAMMFGLPIIVTNVGGSTELIRNEENGLVIPVSSVEQLTEAIVRLLNDPRLAIRLGMSAKDFIRRRFKDVEDHYLRLIHEYTNNFK
jgi:glycosyltransferase involved in cell wall biosynthesis